MKVESFLYSYPRKILLVYLIASLFTTLHASMNAENESRNINRLDSDLVKLTSFSQELKEMEGEMAKLQEEFEVLQRGYFTSDEHDKIEFLLFRYLLFRNSLWDLVAYYRDYKNLFLDSQNQAKGFLIGFSAAQHLAYYTSTLVATFIDEPEVIRKLNEPYFRSDISSGTYDTLFNSVTSVSNLKALRAASEIFSEELKNQKSHLSQLRKLNPKYDALISNITTLLTTANSQILEILEKRSLLLPEIRNQIRHTEIVAFIKDLRKGVQDNLYLLRGIIFTNFSRLKSPAHTSLNFTSAKIKELKSYLAPGDLILTYKDGYMSNIFLPGVFKHGITYVGPVNQRKEIGFDEHLADQVPQSKRKKLIRDMTRKKFISGYEADLIEAVAEGVIFNSLEYLLNEPITRLLVLRPRLNFAQRRQSLLTVFGLLGCGYDFKFDFDDASYQCCTEVIYRALNKLGDIEFTLTKRMGTPTLSADDIIHAFLSDKMKSFEFVLLVHEDKEISPGEAEIRIGAKGEEALMKMMESK